MNIPLEIIVAVLVIITTAIGWMINKGVNTIKELIDVVNEFRIVMAALKEDAKNSSANCNQRHGIIDSRLNTHSAKIEAHGIIIAEHEVKIKELQNK